MWKTLMEIVSTKSKTGDINSVEFEDDAGSVENKFNNFFADSITDIANSIPYVQTNYEGTIIMAPSEISNFQMISLNKLKKVISNLSNKSSGDNNITVRAMKDFFDVIGYPLLHLINTSLTTGKMPTELKCSLIVPVPKVSGPKKPEHCRPINILPVIEKIIEILVYEQLYEYFNKNNILYSGQSGFRHKHSCETSIQLVCSKWRRDIDQGNIVLSVFVDLQRAFETVDRKALIKKCAMYGVKNKVLAWLENYLTDRYHRTKCNGALSEKVKSDYGVPQGSVLGPLLFIIYMNDICSALKNSFVNLFADDTLISVSGENFIEAVNIMNQEMQYLYLWLCSNKLKLNAAKTKGMVLGTKRNCQSFINQNLSVYINNIKVDYVDEIKYLGVVLDPQLNFTKHVEYLCKKIGKKVGYFRRVSDNLSDWCKLAVYNTIIFPHFNYCMSLLISCKKDDIYNLQLLQNKTMRIILNCNMHVPVKDMLNSLKWLNVDQIIEQSTVILVYKIANNLAPQYLQKFLIKRSSLHAYGTRNCDNYHIERSKSNILKKSLFNDGLRLFNELPNEIKQSKNVQTLKHKTKVLYLGI